MSYLTDSEIEALQVSTLDRSTPFGIQGVSASQFSVARHYGGCTYQGKHYTYIPSTDELIRKDVVAWAKKHRKATKRASQAHPTQQQEFGGCE